MYKGKSKYNNKKACYNGITFDSKKEMNRYIELLKMHEEGKINDLELQPSFVLQPSFKKNGKTYRAIKYIADFKYIDMQTKQIVIEDVKASPKMLTDVYKLKKKLFECKYPALEITEIY